MKGGKKCENLKENVLWVVCGVLLNAIVLILAASVLAACESDIGCKYYYAMQTSLNFP